MRNAILSLLLLAMSAMVGAATLSEQIAAMAPGTWARVTTENAARDVDPDPSGAAPYRGNTGFGSIWEAWNSGAWAPSYGTCGGILYYGGGHVDYYGNQVVVLDLCGTTGQPKWTALTQPYAGTLAFPYPTGAFPNGTPSPPHNYDGMEFDPNTNLLWVSESQMMNTTATVSGGGWLFNPTTKKWAGPFQHRGGFEGTAMYDTKRKLIWFQPAQGRAGELTSVDTATNPPTFSYYGWPALYGAGTVDSILAYNPDADTAVMTTFRNAPGMLLERSLAAPRSNWVTMTQLNAPASLRAQHAFEWSPSRHAFIVWMDHDLDGKVYEMKRTSATEYTWSLLTAPSNRLLPITVAHNGSFKKFRLVTIAGVEVLIGQLRLADGVMAFRLPTVGALP